MEQEVKAILTAEDRGYTSTLKNALNNTEAFSQKIKSGIGFGVLMRAGQRAFDVIGSAISSNIAGATKRFDTLQNYPKVMQSLGFSAEEASKSIEKLGDTKSIGHLPTTLDKIASQTQQVVAVTGDLDKATELTLALNNAMAGGGAPAEQQASAINQWVQAMAKGKPDMQDWRALVQTAPAQMNQLAKSLLGATANQTDLYQAMQDGTISIEEVSDAMIDLSKNGGEGFASWEEQAKSAGGGINMALTNIKAGVQRNIANVFDAINKRFEAFGGIAGVFESIITPINAVGDALVSVLNGSTSFADMIDKMLATIGKKAKSFIPKGMEMVGNLLKGIGRQLPKVIKSGINLILDLAMGIAKSFPKLIVKGLNAVTSFINGMSKGDGKLVQKAIDVVVKLVGGIIRSLPKIISAGLKLMASLLQGIIKGFAIIPSKVYSLALKIPNALGRIIGNLVRTGIQMISGLWDGIKSRFSSVIVAVSSLASRIPTAVGRIIGTLTRTGINMISGLWNGIKSRFTSVIGGVASLATRIPSAIRSVAGQFFSIGSQMIAGLWNGISAKFNGVVGKVKAMASRLPSAVKKVLGIASPSKVFAEIGAYTGEGFAIGIERSYRQVQNAMGGLYSLSPSGALGGTMSLNDDYSYNASARYEVVVPVELNGREIARATAGDMQTVLNQRESRANRKVGIR